MNEQDSLARQFESHRSRLRAIAYRILGSRSEADDAVQEAWLRLSGSDAAGVENLGGWLTTVVGRICLNALRARRSHRETTLDVHGPEPLPSSAEHADPEHETLLADSVGVALLVVLDTLDPVERLAFVLHDVFGMPFEEIAPIVERSPTATRQLASRARRRVQHGGAAPRPDLVRQREVVDAFLAASREGDFAGLLKLLDPQVVLRADPAAVAAAAARQAQGAPSLTSEARGARTVAEAFSGRARGARPALIGGAIGAAYAPGGEPRAAFVFTIARGKIVAIEIVADSERLRTIDLKVLD